MVTLYALKVIGKNPKDQCCLVAKIDRKYEYVHDAEKEVRNLDEFYNGLRASKAPTGLEINSCTGIDAIIAVKSDIDIEYTLSSGRVLGDILREEDIRFAATYNGNGNGEINVFTKTICSHLVGAGISSNVNVGEGQYCRCMLEEVYGWRGKFPVGTVSKTENHAGKAAA